MQLLFLFLWRGCHTMRFEHTKENKLIQSVSNTRYSARINSTPSMVILLNPLVMSPDDSPERNLETTGHAPEITSRSDLPSGYFHEKYTQMQSIYYFVVSPHPVDHPIPSFNFGKKLGRKKKWLTTWSWVKDLGKFLEFLLGCPWYLVNGLKPVYKQVVSPLNGL